MSFSFFFWRSEQCSVLVPPSAYPSSTHSPPLHASAVLNIHANPPHPSLTLTVTRSSVAEQASRIVVRWLSDGLVASKGKWEIQLAAAPVPSDLPEDKDPARLEQRTLRDASWAWEVLDGLRRGGVGERMWDGWTDAFQGAREPGQES